MILIKFSHFHVFAATVLFVQFTNVKGHGRVMEPPNRSSLWRFPEFTKEVPANYNDNENYCGGVAVQHEKNKGLCGVCGDNYADPEPRANEIGGLYYRAIIVRNYTMGQVIDVDVELTTSHKGYFEFRICDYSTEKQETQSCFDKNLLQMADGSGSRFRVRTFDRGHYKTQLKLPANLKSEHAVFQWIYITGNSWGGPCEDGTPSGMGCGHTQEQFRSCSDIRVM